jgi:hypothetical protein
LAQMGIEISGGCHGGTLVEWVLKRESGTIVR